MCTLIFFNLLQSKLDDEKRVFGNKSEYDCIVNFMCRIKL